MGFTHAQTTVNAHATSGSTIAATLGSNPAQGSLVIVGVKWRGGAGINTPSSISVSDGNSNAFTATTNSPAAAVGQTAGADYIFYLVAPSNANATVTATFGTTIVSADIWIDNFGVSGGTPAFDQDAIAAPTTTTITTPTIPVAGANELAYAVASTTGAVSSINTPWTGLINPNGNAAAYVLSVSAPQTVNMTASAGNWDVIGASFKITASSGSVFLPSLLVGLGAGGPFFRNPLS